MPLSTLFWLHLSLSLFASLPLIPSLFLFPSLFFHLLLLFSPSFSRPRYLPRYLPLSLPLNPFLSSSPSFSLAPPSLIIFHAPKLLPPPQKVLCSLRVSRKGLSEHELMSMHNLSSHEWSPLFFAMQHVLVSNAGLLT